MSLRELVKDPEQFNKYSGAVQSIVLSAAVLIGGGWTVLTFTRLHSTELADAQAREVRKTLANVVLTGDTVRSGGKCFLKLNAKLTNAGKRDIHVDLSTPPMSLAYLDSTASHFVDLWSVPALAFDQAARHVVALPSSNLVPEESADYAFISEVQAGNMILAEFHVPVIEIVNGGIGRKVKARWFWTARQFFPTCAS